LELRQTAALRLAIHIGALGVGTTRRGSTRIANWFRYPGHGNGITLNIGISSVSRDAFALGPMLDCLAHCIQATFSRTRVHALVVDATVHLGAIGAGVALQSAVGRLSKVSGQAGADGIAIPLQALGIGSARRGLAGIGSGWWWFIANRLAGHKRIARHPLGAVTHGNVVDGIAEGIDATMSRTRIHALLVHTRPIPGAIRVQNALWTASGVGITLVLRQARALPIVAQSIGSAGRGLAGIGGS